MAAGRKKRYIDTNVYEEAKERFRYIYDTHDDVVVSFSGGKDSQVAMHVAYEVAQEYGYKKIKVAYRDEELVPTPVWQHAQWYAEQPWVDMYYLTCQWEATSFILGRVRSYLQWDKNRKWLRDKPSYAITLDGTYDELFGFDEIAANLFSTGKVALITGVRAEESMNRWRSVVNRVTDNYISTSRFTPRLNLCKPLFDWLSNDIFKYMYVNELKYAKVYDWQMWAGDNLRVCSVLHATPAKQLHKLREVDPLVYDQVVSIFPEITVQERYWREFSVDKVVEKYGKSWAEMEQWVVDNLDDIQRPWALKEIEGVRGRAEKTPDSYPLKYVFSQIVQGKYLHPIQPLGKKAQEAYRD